MIVGCCYIVDPVGTVGRGVSRVRGVAERVGRGWLWARRSVEAGCCVGIAAVAYVNLEG